MLLSKTLLHLIYFFKNQTDLKIFLNFNLLYFVKTKVYINYIGLNFFQYFLKRLVKTSYCYCLKIKLSNLNVLNSILIFIFNILKNCNFKSSIKFSNLVRSKSYYSLLRSPFVYKSSQEQFICEYYTAIIFINIQNQNNFLIKY